MKKGLSLFVIVCLLVLEQPGSVLAKPGGPAQPGRSVNLTVDGMVVDWQTPPLQTIRLADGSSELSMAGFSFVQTPGMPRLPEDTLLLTLPPGANPTLDVQVAETSQLPVPGPIALVPGTVVVPGNEGDRVFDLARPGQSTAAAVTLEEIGVMRGVRLARLTFHPLRLVNGSLEVIRQLQVTIKFGLVGPVSGLLTPENLEQDTTLSDLLAAVANPTQLAISPLSNPTTVSLSNRSGQAAIEVSAAGLTAVTRDTLASAGFPVGTVDPHNLHLERAGVEIPMEWDGNDNATFEQGEQLLFYAQPRFSRWTARDVYFLSYSASRSRQALPTRNVVTAGLPAGTLWMDQLFEQNIIYTPDCYCAPIPAGRDGDRWVWDMLRKPDRTNATYPMDLAAVDANQSAQISIWLIGFTDVNLTTHSVQVRMNGTLIGTLVFAGKQANPPDQVTLLIPAGILHSGSNTLGLSLVENGALVDGVWLDAFSIHYAKDSSAVNGQLAANGSAVASQYPLNVSTTGGLLAYDVSDADSPVRLLNVVLDATHAVLADPAGGLPRRYDVVPAGKLLNPDKVRMVVPLQPAQGADYIMITPPDFAPDLADLVILRQSKGLQVVVEDVRAIYDAVDGRPLPESIQAYLANAYAHWTRKPAYVLLVGDGTSDPRNYRAGSTVTWIPPFLADVDPVIGEVAADNRYVMVDGNDTLPDMWIGRLPVNSHVEAAITITKIVQYERNPVPGPWDQRMLLVSDKNDPRVGNFSTENEALMAGYSNGRYTLAQLEYETALSQLVFHQSVLSNWNQGNGLILYNGHASSQQWGADVLFHLNDLPSLVNGNRLPVLLEMTCLTGSFQVPDVPTLDETLLRRSGKGVVAAWGSTGLGLSSGHMLLAHAFLDQIMMDASISIGKAAALAKLKVAATSPALAYYLDTFTLLGDPAMKVNYRYNSLLPAVYKANP